MKSRIPGALFLALLLNAGYISAFAAPSLFYVGNVLLHLFLGALALAFFIPWMTGKWRAAGPAAGFLMVSASPLTRSSHHAGEDFARLRAARAAQRGI